MAVDILSDEGRVIRQLIPLSTLPASVFAQLCSQLEVETLERGQILLGRGDLDDRLYYLLEGSVSLQIDSLKIETIHADSESARFALAHQIPRKVDVIANSKIQFLRLHASVIKTIHVTTPDENERDMIDEELEDSEDWMTTLLKSPIFRNLPPANLQKLLMSLEEVRYQPGEIIIQQGGVGDYYYIIKQGQAILSRKPTANAREIKLAQLGDLDSFGEDALISGEPRNVTITALTDITLFRLGKEQFISLIKQPTLKYVSYQDAVDFVAKGAALIDVRGPDEFKVNHIPRSISVPFFSLRMYLKNLNRQNPIIVVCNNGRTSEAAAFILLRHRFNALVLQGGISSLDPGLIKSPASFVIDDGVETGNFTGEGGSTGADTSVKAEEVNDIQQTIEHLMERCKTLEAEKAALELRCSSLVRHLNALQAELTQLKSQNG